MPTSFSLTIDLTNDPIMNNSDSLQTGLSDKEGRLLDLSSTSAAVLLPNTPITCNNNNLLSFSTLLPNLRLTVPSTYPYNASVKFGRNVQFLVDESGGEGRTIEHVAKHSDIGNSTVLKHSVSSSSSDPVTSAACIGKLLDVGLSNITLSLASSTDADYLRCLVEEIGYLDAEGVPSMGRMGFSAEEVRSRTRGWRSDEITTQSHAVGGDLITHILSYETRLLRNYHYNSHPSSQPLWRLASLIAGLGGGGGGGLGGGYKGDAGRGDCLY